MTTTIRSEPVDDRGDLVHADDPTAQLCLAFVRLEHDIVGRGLSLTTLRSLRVRNASAEPDADLLGILAERLGPATRGVVVEVVADDPGRSAGMLVRLEATVAAPEPRHHEGTSMNPTLTTLTALRELEHVLLPDDAGYADACRPWNLAVAQRPAAVAVPQSTAEVVSAVVAARADGLRIAPQSTGHAASAIADAPFDDLLLLRLHELTGVEIDPAARIARIAGGALWQDVVAAAAPHGLTALHGSAGDVAVAGYVLGGGLSFYGRAHGLAASSVRAIELVTADGELVRASADEHTALFWALRGGGGGLGVVVAIELDLLPVADVVAGMLLWDLSAAPVVVRAWAEWTGTLPESVTTALRLMRFPPLPELPPFLSGRELVVIDGALLEGDERAAELLAPLRALAPELDTFGRMPSAGLLAVHMDPPAPTPGVSDHVMLAGLPQSAIDALLAAAGPGVATPLMAAELRHLGGALARPHDGALSHLDGEYALFAVSAAPTPELAALGERATAQVADALRPWSTGAAFPNFAERATPSASFFSTAALERLRHVHDLYDPRGAWVASHTVDGD
ncbi:FAD-dependent oxidoreductase [Agromyces endophyticus]|uniref:FAD-binding oxidoreductase n=1 Tax=Agromyces sp. H17E-10 TaxID=2932244 RepID=UPI001FD458C8|nr:FAD-binding protein [Agromyces sp. H17E-10]UOQ88702.1 FAD-dependent oxidoreductase [Agromyces sp. H17E-10]